MMGHTGAMMGFGYVGAALWATLFLGLGLIALVVIGALAGVRWLARGEAATGARRGADRALESLRERYARGEIPREEFYRIRQDLSSRVGA